MKVNRKVRAGPRSDGWRTDGPVGASWSTWWVAVVLLLAALAAYGNALPNPFVIDDHLVIVSEARVTQFDVPGIFGREYWSTGGNRLYRPLTLLSFAVNYAISDAPWAFRLPNLLLHVAGAVAVYRLVLALAPGRRWATVLAGLLFIVHPINSMALNQIVDRADLAAAACVLWAACLYLGDCGRGWRRPAAVALLFSIGLFSKENAATLLGVFVVLDLYRRGRESGGAHGP